MKNLFDRLWLPISGSAASIGFKGIESTTSFDPTVLNIPAPESNLFFYFGIGVLGAAGGLCVKIGWSCLKRWFPKYLKNLDQ